MPQKWSKLVIDIMLFSYYIYNSIIWQAGFKILPALCQRSHADRAEYLDLVKLSPIRANWQFPFRLQANRQPHFTEQPLGQERACGPVNSG